MIENAIAKWLDTLDMNLEQMVLAGLALKLAASFDETGNTSTAAELRKTVLELQRALAGSKTDFDPLAEMLRR